MNYSPPLAPEQERIDAFFAACVRSALADEPLPHWPHEWAGPEIERTIIRRSEFHGIAVLLCHKDASFAGWPAAVAAALREETRLALVWEETHRKVLSALLERLDEAGIAASVMKGTALAYHYYDVPAIRRRGDTDLLISPHDLEQTRAILMQSGFHSRADPSGLFFQETWLFDFGGELEHAIDLHWQPTDRPLLQRILPLSEFLRHRTPLPRLAPHVCAPPAIQLLVHGAINQAWHVARGFIVDGARITGGRRLIWAVDYAHITRQFTDAMWEELLLLCQTRDARSIVYAALAGAQKDLGLAIPAEVMAGLKQEPGASRTHRYIASPETIRHKLTDFAAAGTASMRWQILRNALFLPRHYLITLYPQQAHWPTLALQLRRYGDGFVRIFRKHHRR